MTSQGHGAEYGGHLPYGSERADHSGVIPRVRTEPKRPFERGKVPVMPESRALLVQGTKHHGAAITGTQRTSDPRRIATVRIERLRPPLMVTRCGSLRLVEISVECGSYRAKQNAMAMPHADEAILDVYYPVVGQHCQALS